MLRTLLVAFWWLLALVSYAEHSDCPTQPEPGVLDFACWQEEDTVTLNGLWKLEQQSDTFVSIVTPYDTFSTQANETRDFRIRLTNLPTDFDWLLHPGHWHGELTLTLVKLDSKPLEVTPLVVGLSHLTFEDIEPFALRASDNEFELQMQLHPNTVLFSPPVFGSQQALIRGSKYEHLFGALMFGAFVIMGIYQLFFWMGMRKLYALLLLGVCSFVLAIRMLFNERVIQVFWPELSTASIGWIGWLTFYASGAAWAGYFYLRFQNHFVRWVTYALFSASIVGIGLLFIPNVGSWYGSYLYRLVLIICTIFMFSAYISNQARKGDWLEASIGLFVCFSVVLDVYMHFISHVFLIDTSTFGLALFIMMQSFYLARNYQRSLQEKALLSSELQQLNRSLEQTVAQRTKDLKDANRRLKELTLTDELTRLHNRRAFDLRLVEEIERSNRHEHPLALLYLDLDHFKQVNDLHGHGVGDEVLRVFGNMVTRACRSSDFPARIGGEEFAVILPHTQQGAMEFIKRLQIALSEYEFEGEEPFKVSFSAGLAIYRFKEVSAHFVSRADEALYQAKHKGRNRVELAS